MTGAFGLRHLAAAVALCGAVSASASAAPMTFDPTADFVGTLVAEGSIEPETPVAFLAAIKGLQGVRAPTLLISSPGGDVKAALALGTLFRLHHVRAVIARPDPTRPGGRKGGYCASACVYAVMGAERREAPMGAKICLHKMYVAMGAAEGALRQGADSGLVAEVYRYSRRMGFGPEIVAAAESQPQDWVRPMSQAMLAQFAAADAAPN